MRAKEKQPKINKKLRKENYYKKNFFMQKNSKMSKIKLVDT